MPGNSTKPLINLGLDWNPGKWIPTISTGVLFLSPNIFHWSFGIGFINTGVIDFYFASLDVLSLFDYKNDHQISGALSVVLKL